MRKVALLLFIITIILLTIILNFQKEVTISSQEELDPLKDNTLIKTSGLVMKEREFGENSLLILNTSLEIICSCNKYYQNKQVKVKGYKDSLTKKIITLEIK